jgi:diacylglycerol kinase family enzyme
MPPKRVNIILNHKSGKQNGEDQEEILRRALNAHGVEAQFSRIGDYDSVEAAAHAALDDEEAVIAVSGGDGTICGVAAVMIEHDRPFGIIPSGTFNYFARSLDIPEDLEGAVDYLIEGVPGSVDAATINGRVFLNNASIGAYAAILQTREGVYRRWGRSRIAAYWSVIKTLATFRAPLHLTVTIDGEVSTFRTPIIFVINNAFQLEQMGLDGRECIEAGKLVVLVAPDTNRMGMFRHAAALALGMAKPQTDYDMRCGTEIEIEMRRKRRPVVRDGELSRMGGPFRVGKTKRPLQIIMPPQRKDSVR